MRLFEIEEDIKELIQRDCQPYLAQINNNVKDNNLFRGMKRNPKNIITKQGRLDDRKPLNTKDDKHQQMNEYFKNKFGEAFRNSVFVTGDVNEAFKYGEERVVFPIGEFSFCWSPKIKDTTMNVRWPKVQGYDIGATQDQIDALFDGYNYSNTDLLKAIQSGNEIMLRCNSYYAVKIHHFMTVFGY